MSQKEANRLMIKNICEHCMFYDPYICVLSDERMNPDNTCRWFRLHERVLANEE